MLELSVKWSLKNFSLDITLQNDSAILGIFGPSAAGKSTLLRIIAGLTKPDAGEVQLNGRCLFSSSRQKNLVAAQRQIGYVFQEGCLFPHLNVEQNLLYGYRMRSPAERKLEPEQVVRILDIKPILQRNVNNLSGGEKQRVALGRALLCSPDLLLMDEPLAALNAGLKEQILSFVRQISTEFKIPIIYVSHSLSEILELTQQVAVIDQGQLPGYGDYFEVINQPAVFKLANLLGLENILPVTIKRQEEKYQVTIVKLQEQELLVPLTDAAVGEQHFIRVRPQDIILACEMPGNLSAQNMIKGKISRLVQVQDRMLVQVDIGCLLLVEITIKAAEKMELKPGMSINCLIKTYAFHWQP